MDSPDNLYLKEIKLMMIGFGDSLEPNNDTVILVKTIVLKQILQIIQQAVKYSDGETLKGEELVFLMRHNKHKMRRFVRYLHNKQTNNLVKKLQSNMGGYDVDQKPPQSKLMDFIEYIDETGEFTDLTKVDKVKYERQLRADQRSQVLDKQDYIEYCKARRTSFNKGPEDLKRFCIWIGAYENFNFTNEALEVLAYYAYETVAEITDYALLVRMDSKFGTEQNLVASGSTQTFNDQKPITVNEIKEVMRRVYTPQAGVLNFGGKLPETRYLLAL